MWQFPCLVMERMQEPGAYSVAVPLLGNGEDAGARPNSMAVPLLGFMICLYGRMLSWRLRVGLNAGARTRTTSLFLLSSSVVFFLFHSLCSHMRVLGKHSYTSSTFPVAHCTCFFAMQNSPCVGLSFAYQNEL